MAKFCKDIIWGKRYLFINGQNELISLFDDISEVLMTDCWDFDAVKSDDCMHIAAADKSGNLVYIVNNNGHWGRGIAASNVEAENIFINKGEGNTEIVYVSGGGLYKICPDGKDGAVLLDRILCNALPFVCGKAVYYINENEKLCTMNEEICEGREITHIFATGKYLCIKDGDRLDLINTSDFSDKTSLTRRHGRSAECPLYVHTGDVETLCWQDENMVFFSRKKGEKWCSLETFTVQNTERLGVYKFDGNYDLGCLKEGKICSFNIKV